LELLGEQRGRADANTRLELDDAARQDPLTGKAVGYVHANVSEPVQSLDEGQV
jgi:hypothetical protein